MINFTYTKSYLKAAIRSVGSLEMNPTVSVRRTSCPLFLTPNEQKKRVIERKCKTGKRKRVKRMIKIME